MFFLNVSLLRMFECFWKTEDGFAFRDVDIESGDYFEVIFLSYSMSVRAALWSRFSLLHSCFQTCPEESGYALVSLPADKALIYPLICFAFTSMLQSQVFDETAKLSCHVTRKRRQWTHNFLQSTLFFRPCLVCPLFQVLGGFKWSRVMSMWSTTSFFYSWQQHSSLKALYDFSRVLLPRGTAENQLSIVSNSSFSSFALWIGPVVSETRRDAKFSVGCCHNVYQDWHKPIEQYYISCTVLKNFVYVERFLICYWKHYEFRAAHLKLFCTRSSFFRGEKV